MSVTEDETRDRAYTLYRCVLFVVSICSVIGFARAVPDSSPYVMWIVAPVVATILSGIELAVHILP